MTVDVLAGVVTQEIMINIINNSIVECIERFNVRITSVTTCGVTIGTNNMSEVVITDDDGKYNTLKGLCDNPYKCMISQVVKS